MLCLLENVPLKRGKIGILVLFLRHFNLNFGKIKKNKNKTQWFEIIKKVSFLCFSKIKIDPIKGGKIAFSVTQLSHFNLNFDASNVENHKKSLIFQNIEIDDLLNNWEKKFKF